MPKDFQNDYTQELKNINEAKDKTSKLLKYELVQFPYSLFKVRGHYTRNKGLERYFKAMMWLQTATFCFDDDESFKSALLSASLIKNEGINKSNYNSLSSPIDFLIGLPDNYSFQDLSKTMKKKM